MTSSKDKLPKNEEAVPKPMNDTEQGATENLSGVKIGDSSVPVGTVQPDTIIHSFPTTQQYPTSSTMNQVVMTDTGTNESQIIALGVPGVSSRLRHGRWKPFEHKRFVDGIKIHGKEWKKIADVVNTRTVVQIRTHAQKYFLKLERDALRRANGGVLPKNLPASKVSTKKNKKSKPSPKKKIVMKKRRESAKKRKSGTNDMSTAVSRGGYMYSDYNPSMLSLMAPNTKTTFNPRDGSPTAVSDISLPYQMDISSGSKRHKTDTLQLSDRVNDSATELSELFSCPITNNSGMESIVTGETNDGMLTNWLNDVGTSAPLGLRSDTEGSSDNNSDTVSNFQSNGNSISADCGKWEESWSQPFDFGASFDKLPMLEIENS